MQDEADASRAAEVTIGERGSDQDPLSGRDPVLAIDPVRQAPINQVQGIQGVPALRVLVDPRTLGVAPGEPLPRLRREGEAVRRRDGQLLPAADRGYAVFILEADPAQGDDQPLAMIIAPCMTLESMEQMLEVQGEDLRFTITGEVHTYRGVNYLLPTSQPSPWLVDARPSDGEVVIEGAPGEADTDADTDTDDPTSGEQAQDATGDASAEQADGPATGGGTPSAEDVLNQLLQQRAEPPSPIDPNVGTAAGGPNVYEGPDLLRDPLLLGLDPDQPLAELMDEGQFIIARRGRLIRSGDGAHALFVLDSDRRDSPEPPMIMHACKLLESMEATVLDQGSDVPFIVTGQVYVYRGANYLLPTIVRREFDRGNLE